jgi:hypothetical protein
MDDVAEVEGRLNSQRETESKSDVSTPVAEEPGNEIQQTTPDKAPEEDEETLD